MTDQPLYRPRGAVCQRADRMTLDLVRNVEQHVHLCYRGVALDHALHDPPYPPETLAARGALAAALMLVEFRQPRDRLHDVRRFIHHDDRRRAESTLDGDEAVEIHQHRLADRLRYYRYRRAARNDREEVVPAAAYPARVPLDQLAQRDAHRFLDIAGRVHMARQTVDLGAGIPRPANPGKPRGTAPQDLRNHGDCLDVVDGARAAIEPDLGWKGRLQPRLALASFETFEKAGLFATDIGTGPAVQVEVEGIAGAARILADQTAVIGFVDRGLQTLCLVIELAPDIDVAIVDSHPRRGQQAPLDELVRLVAQDVAVLAGARLAFIGIDAEIGRMVALFRHERPFQPGRKAGAAAAAQPGFLDLLDDPVASLEDQLLGAVP